MAMTKIQLNLAGWLSIILALTYVPILIITVLMTVQGFEQGIKQAREQASGRATEQTTVQNPDVLRLNLMFSLVCLGLFVYIMIQLKILLNSRFQFHDVDTIILILIALLIVSTIVSTISILLLLGSAGAKTVATIIVSIISAVMAIFYGIFEIIFSRRILHLSDNLFGLLKPYSYTAMAGGICMVTVILAPLAIIVGIVNYVILGMIFFGATEGLSPIEEKNV